MSDTFNDASSYENTNNVGSYLTPHIHYNTKNISAVKTAYILSQLGVKNNKFILTLYDQELANVDPYSENLSPEIQHRIHAEIVRNYWYFLREIVRIDVPGGKTRFDFQRGNTAISWLLINNINLYVELPRQMTKSGTIAAFFAYIWGFRSINSISSFMSKDPENTRANLEHVKSLLRNLPPYLQVYDENKDRSNTERIEGSESKNVILLRFPAGNESQAMNKGRGSSEPEQWDDEVPFIRFNREVILNSGPSWARAAELAKSNNVPYGRCFSSTPGVLGTDTGDFIYYDFLPQCVKFDEKIMYDQPNIEATRNLISRESKNDFVYVRFTYKQLGKGEDYFLNQCKILMHDQESIDREVLLKWSMRSVDSPFTKEQLDRAFKSVIDPIGTITIRNTYVLKFFKKPDFNKIYMISVDCSGMLNNDYSSLTVTDPQTFEPIATLRSNARTFISNTRNFSLAIGDIMENIFPKAILAIEINNMGVAVIDNITEEYPDLIPRMYSSTFEPSAHGSGLMLDSQTNDIYNDKKIVVYGFQTNQPRREQMFSEILGIIINELYDCINDNDIYNELNGIIKKNGRLDHKDGHHDDMLFSWLIGLWVLCYSKILNERYDVPFGYIRPMSIVDPDDPKAASELDNENHEKTIEEMAKKLSQNFQNSQFSSGYQDMIQYDKDRYGIQGSNDIVNERESIDDDNGPLNSKCPDGNMICDIVFGSGDSGINEEAGPDLETIENFKAGPVEDIAHKAAELNVQDRKAFMQNQTSILDKQIADAKEKKAKNLEKARLVRRQKKLREDLLDTDLSQDDKDKYMDSFVDSFINNQLQQK